MNKLTTVGRPLVCLFLFFAFATPAFSINYYWVNGSGLWSEFATHWAKIPVPLVPSDYHANIPTADDDVFFLNNGGTAYTVTVNAGSTVPKCHNMDWSAAPAGTVWAGGGGNQDIYGSLTMDANMSMTFNGQLHFISDDTTTKGVFSDGVQISGQVYFEGTDGGWQLMDDIYCGYNLLHLGGSLMTNGHKVTIVGNFAGVSNVAQLNLGNSEFILLTGSAEFKYATTNFNAGTSHIKLFGNAQYLTGYDNMASEMRFHDVSCFTPSSRFLWGHITGTLTFHSNGIIDAQSAYTTPELNNVIFLQDGTIHNAVNYHHLTFTAGKTYTVTKINGTINGTDQTILPGGTLTALGAGTCSEFITIKSWQYGTHFNFVNNSGTTQTVHCAIIEDCHATGSDPLVCNDGINLGNTTGWTFMNPNPGVNLFWVGGAGDWNNPAHWSDTDGGAPGTCIPNGGSNVFFTANSGFSAGDVVTVNADAYCANMDWTGVTGMPEIYHVIGGTTNLHIYGSIKLASDMDFNFGGTVRFRTSNTSTITSVSQNFDYIVVFEGSGTWELQDSFKVVNHYLFHKRGTFKSLGHAMLINYWFGNSNEDSSLSNMGAELFLNGPGGSSNVFLVKNFNVSGNKGHFRCWYETGKFHAAQSHFIGTHGGYIDCNPPVFHDFWNVTFNPIDHAGDFLYSNVLNKLTFLGGANLISSNTYNPAQPSNIHEAEFHQGGYIYGSNTFDILTMSGGYSYKLEHNNTVQTITAGGSFNQLNGSCTAPIHLYNPIPGSSTTIRKEGAGTNFNIHNAIFDQVYADQTTGANYVATNSFAVQPAVAASWNITNGAGRNLYWVGGNGNWNDPAHWSLTSGGAGGECPPSAQDNVFFDASSGLGGGQAVTLDARFSFCKNMDWTNVPSGTLFNSATPYQGDPYNGNNLTIFGSLAFSANMTNNITGIYRLRANGPATIKSAGQTFKNDLLFWSDTGHWTLLDDLSTVPNSNVVIDHWYGELTTNNFNITCGGWNFTYRYDWYTLPQPSSAKINLGSSKLTVWAANLYNSQSFFYHYAAGNFNAGTSEIILEATGPGDNVYAGGYSGLPQQVFHDITIKGTGGLYGGQVDGKLLIKNTGFVSDGGRIKNLEFEGDGNFIAYGGYSRDVHSVKFAAGKRYTVTSNFTVNIVPMGTMEGQFIAQGQPGQYIELKSSDPAQQAIIHMDDLNGTSTCTKYLFLTGMNHTGTEDIYVPTPGGDVQNNAGWQFFPCNPCPASIPVLDVAASITSGCPPGQAKLVLAGLKPDETAYWYTDPAATTNLVYQGMLSNPDGGNLFQPVITGPMTYYARVYSDGGLCESTVVLAVDITIIAPPMIFNVMGGGSGCVGSNFAVWLDDSEVDVDYVLYKDGVEIGPLKPGDGDSISFGLQNMAGAYTVRANTHGTSCPIFMNGGVNITASALTAPMVIATGPATLCGGYSLNLAETGGDATMWAWTGPSGYTSSDQNPSIGFAMPTNSGIYTVVGTAANGCTNTAQVSVMVNDPLQVSVNWNEETCFGAGDSYIHLIVSGGSGTYAVMWNFGGNGFSYTGVPPGMYSATVQDNAGCIASVGFFLAQPIPLSLDPVSVTHVSCGGSMDGAISIAPSGGLPGGYFFHWEGPGGYTSSMEDISGLGTGVYYCTISDGNGCTFSPAGFSVNSNSNPTIDPVPNQDLCENTSTAPVNFNGSPAGLTFNWTNSHPAIGIPANGSGNIWAFTALNGSNVPIVATISVTPIAPGGCMGPAATFTITVNPVPDPAAGYCQQAFCVGDNPTVAVLLPGGPNVKWYLTPTGGIPLATSTPLVSGTYYAENLTGGCASSVRSSVMVSVVTPLPGHVCIGGCSN